ncbi:hypothetical protein ACFVFQ_31620 [Streptomyces sp. NPDC057743]|uniref:hypothetical protein n=1 Tax=Streptomyces sp. NPDC057743 TaxID=3346236 RepID=UPI00369B84F8
MLAIVWSWGAGFALLAGLNFAIQDCAATQDAGVPPAQIFLDAWGQGATKSLLLFVIVTQLSCGNAEASRVLGHDLRFSRDPALLPGRGVCNGTSRTGVGAVVWVGFLTIPFCLPQHYPMTADTFNYAPIAFVAVPGAETLWWWFAKRVYTVPAAPVDPDLEDLERHVI